MKITIKDSILFNDLFPWFNGNTDEYLKSINEYYNLYYKYLFDKEKIEKDLVEMIQHLARPGDIWILPLMASSCVIKLLVNKFRDIYYIAWPCSRHPFWTVSAGGVDESVEAVLGKYSEYSKIICNMKYKEKLYKAARIVYFDINSTTGKDYAIIRDMFMNKIETKFYVMFNEVNKNDINFSTGNRIERKTSVPDNWLYTVKGYNVKYLSHLVCLTQYTEEQRESLAEYYIKKFSGILEYWNTEEFMVYSKHQYVHKLGSPKAWKSRVRFTPDEINNMMDLNSNLVLKRGNLRLISDKANEIFSFRL